MNSDLCCMQVLNYQKDGCAPRWLTMGTLASLRTICAL